LFVFVRAGAHENRRRNIMRLEEYAAPPKEVKKPYKTAFTSPKHGIRFIFRKRLQGALGRFVPIISITS